MSRNRRTMKLVPMLQTGTATLVAGTVTVNTALVPSLKLLRGCVIWARPTNAPANTGQHCIIEASTAYSTVNSTTNIVAGTPSFVITSTNAMDVSVSRWFVLSAIGLDAPNQLAS